MSKQPSTKEFVSTFHISSKLCKTSGKFWHFSLPDRVNGRLANPRLVSVKMLHFYSPNKVTPGIKFLHLEGVFGSQAQIESIGTFIDGKGKRYRTFPLISNGENVQNLCKRVVKTNACHVEIHGIISFNNPDEVDEGTIDTWDLVIEFVFKGMG